MAVELARVEQLERSHDSLAVAGIDLRCRPRRPLAQHAVQRRGPAALELGQPALARALGRAAAAG